MQIAFYEYTYSGKLERQGGKNFPFVFLPYQAVVQCLLSPLPPPRPALRDVVLPGHRLLFGVQRSQGRPNKTNRTIPTNTAGHVRVWYSLTLVERKIIDRSDFSCLISRRLTFFYKIRVVSRGRHCQRNGQLHPVAPRSGDPLWRR